MSFKMKELLLLNKVILAYWTMMMYFGCMAEYHQLNFGFLINYIFFRLLGSLARY